MLQLQTAGKTMTMLSELASEVSRMVEDVVDEEEEEEEISDCPLENMEVVELVLMLLDLEDKRGKIDNLFHLPADLCSGHPAADDYRTLLKLYCHFQGILTLFHCTCLQLTPGLQSLQQEEIKQEI